MFELTQQPSKIDSFTPRAEFAGDETVPAGSVRVSLSGHSSLLDNFLPGMRSVLFRKPALAGEQPPLFEGDDLTQIAFAKLKPLGFDEKFPGYRVEISEGLEASTPLVLDKCTLSNFSFKPVNGGAIAISFSVACHPNEDQAGALCQLIQQEPYITLVAPTATAQAEGQQQLNVEPGQDTLDAQEQQAERDRLANLGSGAAVATGE